MLTRDDTSLCFLEGGASETQAGIQPRHVDVQKRGMRQHYTFLSARKSRYSSKTYGCMIQEPRTLARNTLERKIFQWNNIPSNKALLMRQHNGD